MAPELIFSALYAIAAAVNHIDDTDETYGYYEPIHYLLYGIGMQTWEYSPEYSIRSYAFLAPFASIGAVLKALGFSELQVFFGIRLIIGQIMALSIAGIVRRLKSVFGEDRCIYTVVALACCPGLFFCSTALLPSAIACALVVTGMACFLAGRHGCTILCGCLAVLWTGWPFVGLIFLPLGILILYKEYSASGVNGLFKITAIGAFHLVVVSAVVLAIDTTYYGKMTFPPVNILLYNAITGSGDELYGIEPTSYYIKNLLLTVGLSFPLAILEIICFSVDLVYSLFGKAVAKSADAVTSEAALCLSTVLWMALLFSRPHKEERFMYPVYPLLCILASFALVRLENTLANALLLFPRAAHQGEKTSEKPSTKQGGRTRQNKEPALVGATRKLFFTLIVAALGIISSCRVCALYNNYSGYFDLWRQVREQLRYDLSENNRLHERLPPGTHIDMDKLINEAIDGDLMAILCIGSEWYTFPSHFFLPSSVRLEYIRDGFGGILPQHFAPVNGTATNPIQPFNDKNREEVSRYAGLADCDYLIRLMREEDREQSSKNGRYFDELSFAPLVSTKVIDSANSPMFSRAFHLPGFEDLSRSKNSYFNYTLFHVNF